MKPIIGKPPAVRPKLSSLDCLDLIELYGLFLEAAQRNRSPERMPETTEFRFAQQCLYMARKKFSWEEMAEKAQIVGVELTRELVQFAESHRNNVIPARSNLRHEELVLLFEIFDRASCRNYGEERRRQSSEYWYGQSCWEIAARNYGQESTEELYQEMIA